MNRARVASCSRVYPRACGGTAECLWEGNALAGLSPRVRGNPPVPAPVPAPFRSIPARAGEPPAIPRSSSTSPVYPRACGGTRPPRRRATVPAGLSPRVRGNPKLRRAVPSYTRSIPARAGEPKRDPGLDIRSRVYPRACGGTLSKDDPRLLLVGLSPRVRGNPLSKDDPRLLLVGLSPRVRGNPLSKNDPRLLLVGLSPRVRGNLREPDPQRVAAGSIPARAGEP